MLVLLPVPVPLPGLPVRLGPQRGLVVARVLSTSTSAACGLHRGHTRVKHYGFYLQIYRIPTVHLKQSLPLHQATEEELRGLVHNQQRERGGSASQCITPSVQDNKGAMSHSGDSPMSLVDGCLMQPPGSPSLCPSSSPVVMHRRQAFPPTQALRCVSVISSVDHRGP